MQPDDPRLSAAARHALHDEEVVAAFAVDAELADDPARARALIERCMTCRDLHGDLVAIGSAMKAAGTAEAVAPARPAPRDFRLTATDAVRLRGGNALQRAAARLLDGLAAFGRPIGATLATFGIVGLLVGTATLGSLGGAAATGAEATGAPAAAPTNDLAAGNPPGATPTIDRLSAGPKATDAREEFTTADMDAGLGSSAAPWLFAGSVTLVAVGLAVLLIGARQRRHLPVRTRQRT
jgi:hypothetical protein